MRSLVDNFGKGLATLFLFLGPIFLVHAQSTGAHLPDQPGYYRMHLGDADVIALSDGTLPLHVKQMLHESTPGEMDAFLRHNYLDTVIENSINGFLVKTGDQLILVDAGTGSFFGPSLGKLKQQLLAAGFQPEQITAVLLTHLHVDHSGGLVNGSQRVFPNATVYIAKAEAGFWLNPANKATANKRAAPFFDFAIASIQPYKDAGKVRLFEPGEMLFPGITALSTTGHTPGHTSYMLESKGQRMLFMGDLVHAASVQLEDIAVTIDFDVDLAGAAAARKKIFADAVQQRYWIAAPHISFPGIGHLAADGKHFDWIPANYTTTF